jgi:hypothetical protein
MGAFHRWQSWESGTHGHAYLTSRHYGCCSDEHAVKYTFLSVHSAQGNKTIRNKNILCSSTVSTVLHSFYLLTNVVNPVVIRGTVQTGNVSIYSFMISACTDVWYASPKSLSSTYILPKVEMVWATPIHCFMIFPKYMRHKMFEAFWRAVWFLLHIEFILLDLGDFSYRDTGLSEHPSYGFFPGKTSEGHLNLQMHCRFSSSTHIWTSSNPIHMATCNMMYMLGEELLDSCSSRESCSHRMCKTLHPH